jgi:tetratricopeptide (TPR) repeat protein
MREINGLQQRGFVPNGLSLLAEIYADKFGDYERSEFVARECLSVSPHYANAHFQLGKALVAQGRYDEGREAFFGAIDDGKYAHLQFVLDDQVYIWKAYSEIGASYVAQQDDANATQWFRKGLENAPNVEPLMINLARSLDRQQRFEEAEEVLRRAFHTHRDDMTAIDYVNFLLRRRRGLEALAAIEEVHAELSDEGAAALLVAASQIARFGRDSQSARGALSRRGPRRRSEGAPRARGSLLAQGRCGLRAAVVPSVAGWRLERRHGVCRCRSCHCG